MMDHLCLKLIFITLTQYIKIIKWERHSYVYALTSLEFIYKIVYFKKLYINN